MYQFNSDGFAYPVRPHDHLELNPNGSVSRRDRRQRTTFTRQQLEILEDSFTVSQFPDYPDRMRMAEDFGMDERRIQVWFKNRRAKFRMQKKMSFHAEMESFSVAPDGPPVCKEEQIPAPTPLGRPKKPKPMEYEPILYHLDTAATFYKLDMVGSAAGGDAMAGDGTATPSVAGGGDSPVVIHRKIIKIKRQSDRPVVSYADATAAYFARKAAAAPCVSPVPAPAPSAESDQPQPTLSDAFNFYQQQQQQQEQQEKKQQQNPQQPSPFYPTDYYTDLNNL